MDYFIRMWNQAALAMEVYQAETAVNTLFEKLEPMASILDPGASQSTTNPIFGMPSLAAQHRLASCRRRLPRPSANWVR